MENAKKKIRYKYMKLWLTPIWFLV